MANNTISFSLELRSDPYSMDYATKLDRLVEAAEAAKQVMWRVSGQLKYGTSSIDRSHDELAAALAAIKLEEETEDA